MKSWYKNLDEIKYINYFNIPISIGVSYKAKLNDSFSILASVGPCYNFLKLSNLEVKYSDKELTVSHDWANSMGFKLGVGLVIKELFIIEIKHLSLGDYKINVNASDEEYFPYFFMDVDIFNICVGVRI